MPSDVRRSPSLPIPAQGALASIVIAAHNEEAVIGACLESILQQIGSTHVQVIVSANGCTDRTVEVARGYGVTVLDRAEAGKAAALNAADQIATCFPRIYLDADIVVPPGAVDSILRRFRESSTTLAVVPRRRVDTAGRPPAVKGYFAINERLPAFSQGLFGRGVIAVAEDGRTRFGDFPLMVADDLFLDSLFTSEERAVLADLEVVVQAPRATSDLLRRLVRVRRGNAQMRAAATAGQLRLTVRPSDKWAWLRDVVLSEPRLVPAAVPYVMLTVVAGFLARRASDTWGRDDSTRLTAPVVTAGVAVAAGNGGPS